jgi:hypothetical protein
MTVSGSITKTGSTSTSISVSWYITGDSNFAEIYVNGNGQNLLGFDGGFGASSPVSGSATVTGLSPSTSYTFNWGAIDGTSAEGLGSYSFSTDAAPPPPSPPAWTDNTIFGTAFKNVAYSDGVSATNSPTYSVVSGSLPPGISLNSSTGAITGTATSVGTYNFTVRATNESGFVSASLSLQVILPFSITFVNITNITQNSFSFGYLATNEDNGSSANVSFSISPSGTISTPTSFTVVAGGINDGTRNVTGLSPGTTYTVTATMTSGGDTLTDTEIVTTASPAPTFTDSSVAVSATIISAYSDAVSATFTNSYSVFSGSLPPGINLNTSTGALTGTPTTPGTYNFVIRATGPGGSTDTGTLTILVYGDLRTQMSVDVGNLGNFLDDPFEAQSCQFSYYATNDTDITATLTLSVSPSATMSGPSSYAVPAVGGEVGPEFKTLSNMDHGRRYTITATLTLAGNLASVTDTLVIERMLYVDSTPNPGIEDCPYDNFAFAVVSYSPATFSIVSGSLPPGLSLGSAVADTVTGYYNTAYSATVSGTPTTIGTYNFTVRATNSQFFAEVSRQIVISEAVDSGLVLSMYNLEQPVEYSPGLWSANFVLEIDNTLSAQGGSGGLLEVVGHPEISFSDESFEISANGFETRNITVFGMANDDLYTVTATMTINCFETVATLDIIVGIAPGGTVKVKVEGVWKTGTIYVKSDGVWKESNIFIKSGGAWKLSQQ